MAHESRKPIASGMALVGASVVLVFVTVGGYYLGKWLDDTLGGGQPFWAFIGLVLGVLVGFWGLYRVARILMQQEDIAKMGAGYENPEKYLEIKGDRDSDHEPE